MIKKQSTLITKGVRTLTLFVLVAAIIFAVPVSAEGDGLVVSVERLNGLGVGIKIVFPENVSPDLSGFINQKKLDCNAIAPDTLYCIGNLRPNHSVTLSFYNGTSEMVTFKTVVSGPDRIESDDPDPCLFKIFSLQKNIRFPCKR